MKATRHNGRSGKHGTYDAKHNDRRFDVENSEHIDAERTKMNVYWDCYQGYSLPNDKDERARYQKKEYGTLGSICNPLVEIQMLFYCPERIVWEYLMK